MTNVSNALIAKQSKFITWPKDAEVAEVKNSFYQRGGFPCVIGCVDGSHIKRVSDALTSELLRTHWRARVIFVGWTCEPHHTVHH